MKHKIKITEDSESDASIIDTTINKNYTLSGVGINVDKSEGYLQWNSKGELVNVTAQV